MQLDHLRSHLESLDPARPLLHAWGLRDAEHGWHNLRHLAEAIGVEALRDLCHPLGRLLPRCPDPDMALNNLERFLADPAGARQVPLLLEGRARTLEKLLQLLSTSQYFSDLLYTNPDYLDMLKVPLRRSPSDKELVEQLQAEVDGAFEDSAVLRVFRRFRQRQILRIGTNDIIRDRTLEEQFVYAGKKSRRKEQAVSVAAALPPVAPEPPVQPLREAIASATENPKLAPLTGIGRVPVGARIRTELAAALKRASLERQLQGLEPNTVQDILEEALEPWLRRHGYLK